MAGNIDTTKTIISSTKNFVHKLYDEIESSEDSEDLIVWNAKDDGKSFIIQDTNLFSVTTLPRLFKHSNYSSFVRQLNKYGFHKLKQMNPQDAENTIKNSNIFKNIYFQRGRPDLLKNIKRQETNSLSKSKKEMGPGSKQETVSNDDRSTVLLEKLMVFERQMAELFKKQDERIKYLELEISELKSKTSHSSASPMQEQMPSHFYHSLSPNIEIPPDEQEQHAKQEQEISSKKLPPGFHILLCEDDDICIQICEKFLKKLNCQSTVVNDGLSCIQKLKDNPHKYDLILMDIIIPQLDGTTTTAVIRSMNANIPIIAMTGNVNEDDLLQYLQNGMTDVLAKPFNRRDLQDMLVRYLGNASPQERR